jgi:hypothetical protein
LIDSLHSVPIYSFIYTHAHEDVSSW